MGSLIAEIKLQVDKRNKKGTVQKLSDIFGKE